MNFAIVGDPVAHSRSPAIHNAAFVELGIDATFDFLRVSATDFEGVENSLRSGHLDGVSVTMPHKSNAHSAVDDMSDVASATGAVNTIVIRDGALFGHNTDVAGVTYAIKEADVLTPDGPYLVLGAGGAASAALKALAGRDIYVSARTRDDATKLAHKHGTDGVVVPWGEAVPLATVINATPLGMHGESLPPGIVERAGAFFDMTYGAERSPSLVTAISLGIPFADGLTMLVGQAIEAFELFTGQPAPVAVMETAARA